MTDNALLRAVAKRTGTETPRNQLQRFDWLQAALEIFVTEGIDAVRITRLASELNVTRGSFYWHFSDRDELIDVLVHYWRDKSTNAIVAAMEGASSLSDGIFRFFDTCLDTSLFDARLDLAIREWARRSPQIRKELDLADNTRVHSITDFFTRFGYPMPEALIRARVIYFAQIGFYALEVTEPLTTRISYTESYYECFTGKPLDPDDASAFKQQIMQKYEGRLP